MGLLLSEKKIKALGALSPGLRHGFFLPQQQQPGPSDDFIFMPQTPGMSNVFSQTPGLLKALLENTKPKKPDWKSVIAPTIGGVIAGALGKALTGSDTFGAGIAAGATNVALARLKEQQEAAKRALEMRGKLINTFVGKYIEAWIDTQKELAESERERQKLNLFSTKFGELIDQHKSGTIDSKEFTARTLQLALDVGLPKDFFDHLEDYLTAFSKSKTTKEIGKKLLNMDPNKAWVRFNPQTGEYKVVRKAPSKAVSGGSVPREIAIYKWLRQNNPNFKMSPDQFILWYKSKDPTVAAIELAQNDTRLLTGEKSLKDLVQEYYQILAGDFQNIEDTTTQSLEPPQEVWSWNSEKNDWERIR